MIEATIFDFDGTLVDSMPLHLAAYQRAFEEMGLRLAAETFYANVGGKASETIPRFLAGERAPWPIERIHRRKRELLEEILSDDLTCFEVLETALLVPVLRQIGPTAIASSGSRDGIEQMLNRLGWRGHFDVVLTGEDVNEGKPAPEIFLLAAARLNVRAAHCIVFEDTDDGVAAARAAGMTVFDVRRTVRGRAQ